MKIPLVGGNYDGKTLPLGGRTIAVGTYFRVADRSGGVQMYEVTVSGRGCYVRDAEWYDDTVQYATFHDGRLR